MTCVPGRESPTSSDGWGPRATEVNWEPQAPPLPVVDPGDAPAAGEWGDTPPADGWGAARRWREDTGDDDNDGGDGDERGEDGGRRWRDGDERGDDGGRRWRNAAGALDRGDDLPAVMRTAWVGGRAVDGDREWWAGGRRHRAGGRPAVERPDWGDLTRHPRREWWVGGVRQPPPELGLAPARAAEWRAENLDGFRPEAAGEEPGAPPRAARRAGAPGADGVRLWTAGPGGPLHRGGDRPAVMTPGGYRAWYWRGFRHRATGGPAVVAADGAQHWYDMGMRHRDAGLPAVERPQGAAGAAAEWWVAGSRAAGPEEARERSTLRNRSSRVSADD